MVRCAEAPRPSLSDLGRRSLDAEDMACVVARSPWAIQITVSANSIRTTKAFRKRSRSVGLPQLARQNRMASVL